MRLWEKEDKLIHNLFLYSLGTFFLSMLTASLGSIVDGLVIGNTMKTHTVAAFSLINPLNFVFAIIGSVLNSGSANACARALGRNEPDKARAMFSATNIAGFGMSVLVMLVILLFADPILRVLGAKQGTQTFDDAKGYLIGYIFGLPAITGTKLLSSVMQLDSDRPRVVVSTAVMTIVNILGDLLCVFVFHTGLAAIAVVTTVSYYAGLAVLLLHFRKKGTIFHLSFRSPDWKALGNVVLKGMPKGVSRITSSIRGVYINRMAAGIAATVVAGYAVQANLNYLANAVVMAIAQAFMLLVSVYHGEENKKALKRVICVASVYELVFTGLLAAGLFAFAPVVVRMYLGKNVDAYAAGISSVRWYAVGLLFQGFCILFADYLQATGEIMRANMVYVLEDILFTVGAVAILRTRFGSDGIFAGIAAAQMLMFLFIPAFVMLRNRRRIRSTEDFLMLKDSFGVAPENEYVMTVTDMQGVITASSEIICFCREKGMDEKTASRLGLATEEMAGNIIEYGFADGKKHYIDLRAQYKGGEGITLIMRDDCKLFDPKERYSYLTSDDPTANIGLRITMNLAKDVSYISSMKLNNLTIRI